MNSKEQKPANIARPPPKMATVPPITQRAFVGYKGRVQCGVQGIYTKDIYPLYPSLYPPFVPYKVRGRGGYKGRYNGHRGLAIKLVGKKYLRRKKILLGKKNGGNFELSVLPRAF